MALVKGRKMIEANTTTTIEGGTPSHASIVNVIRSESALAVPMNSARVGGSAASFDGGRCCTFPPFSSM
nr:hypothetical protein Itr_chr11CG01740 [Ipomoea trifida]